MKNKKLQGFLMMSPFVIVLFSMIGYLIFNDPKALLFILILFSTFLILGGIGYSLARGFIILNNEYSKKNL